MDAKNEVPQVEPREPDSSSGWAGIRRVLFVLLSGAIGLVGGCLNGATYGGNYAPDFSFLGQPGYEGSGLMGAIVSAASILVIAGLSIGLLRRGSAALSIIGALLAISFAPSAFYTMIAPSEGLFALSFIGSAILGALIGAALGLLIPDSD
ncbi:hypothetical protein ACFLSW_03830 [Candidatus Bipolaricaulota bacterium]